MPVDFSGSQPKAGNESQITADGGDTPVWARDGRELFFTNLAESALYATSFATSQGMVHAGSVVKLFNLASHSSSSRFYDVSPDGKKFYVAEAPQDSAPQLTVVTNWRARTRR